ncbi:MAG: pilus assembly protein TadG-related protein [Actinomycetota bacterium]
MSEHPTPPTITTPSIDTARPGPDRADVGSEGERGYVAPMAALLLIPLMIFAALAVDVGAWYVRADQTQKAADAAALAGTVWLPDQARALEVARDVAARNGFRDPAWVAVNGGVANAAVSVPGISGSNGLIVEIDTTTPSYFGSVVLDQINISRRAVAEVSSPVRLGNPSNALGTGNLDSSELGVTPDGVWLSLNGWCQDHQQGDPISVGFFGAALAGGTIWDSCNTANQGANPTYDPDGYTFIVDVPAGAGQVELEVFEPGLCTDADTSDLFYSANDNYWRGPQLNFRVFANDATELYHADNLASTPVVETLYATTDCTGGNGPGGRWYPLHTIPAGSSNEGRWYIQANVRALSTETNLNSFALRARPTADTQLCSSMLSATCPEIYGLDYLSVFRPNFGSGTFVGQPAEFFLADISDEYAGKSVQITMFDPGEGMDNVQFLDPAGAEVDFDFRLANCSAGQMCSNNTAWPETSAGSNDDCSGVPCLDVTSSRFQDQWIIMTVDLPATYSCGGNCWWKVRYTPSSGAVVTDRTTWSVKIIGDPVHLTE